jgi:hypothetical protein
MATAIGAAAQFVAKEFGGNFRVRQTTVPVDTASVVVAPNDPDRVWLSIINTGTTSITLSFRPTAIAGQGILLLDNGSVYSVQVRDDAILPAWALSAIGDLAGGTLEVFEITMESQS